MCTFTWRSLHHTLVRDTVPAPGPPSSPSDGPCRWPTTARFVLPTWWPAVAFACSSPPRPLPLVQKPVSKQGARVNSRLAQRVELQSAPRPWKQRFTKFRPCGSWPQGPKVLYHYFGVKGTAPVRLSTTKPSKHWKSHTRSAVMRTVTWRSLHHTLLRNTVPHPLTHPHLHPQRSPLCPRQAPVVAGKGAQSPTCHT